MPCIFSWNPALLLAAIMAMLAPLAFAEGDGIPWRTDLDTAKADAAKENKLIFLDIHAEWCPPCKMLEQKTFPDPGVQKLLSEFIPLSIDVDKSQGDVLEKYSSGSLPTLAVIDAKGRMLDNSVGYLGPEEFVTWLNQARHGGEEIDALAAKLKEAPQDAKLALELANRYVRVLDGDAAVALLKDLPGDAVAKLPESDQAQLLYTLGMAAYDAENFDVGVKAMRDFQSQFPKDPRADSAAGLILQGVYMGGRKAFQEGDLEKARAAFTEIAKDTTMPGAAETAQVELARLDKIGQTGAQLDVAEWISGEPVDPASLKGKVVLLDFFQIIDPATEEFRPQVEAVREQFASAGLQTVGIAVAFVSEEQQQPDAIKAYVAEHKYAYPVAIDKELSKTFLSYAGIGSPWTAILDKEGKIVYLDFFDKARVTAKLESLLGK